MFHNIVTSLKDVKRECFFFPCCVFLFQILASACIPITSLPWYELDTQELYSTLWQVSQWLQIENTKVMLSRWPWRCSAWTSSAVWSWWHTGIGFPIYVTRGAMHSSEEFSWFTEYRAIHASRKDMRISCLTDDHICHLLCRQKGGFLSLLPTNWGCTFEKPFPAHVRPGITNAESIHNAYKALQIEN